MTEESTSIEVAGSAQAAQQGGSAAGVMKNLFASVWHSSHRWVFLVAAEHFLLSFVFERYMMLGGGLNEAKDFLATAVRPGEHLSDSAESWMFYATSKLFCLIFVCAFWYAIYKLSGSFSSWWRDRKRDCLIFGVLWAILTVLNLLLYPQNFLLDIDNATLLGAAVRGTPVYWHSFYTVAAFLGVLMAFIHPVFIGLVQVALSVALMVYVYHKTEEYLPGSRYRYLSLLCLTLPSTWVMINNPLRPDIFALLCVFYFSYTIFNAALLHRELSYGTLITWAVMSAFMALLRSEGLIICLIQVAMLCALEGWRKKLCFSLTLLLSLCILSYPNHVAKDKYYGQDYMIINMVLPLHSILNSPYAHKNYQFADQDLAKIDKVIPLKVIKENGGVALHRGYEYSRGLKDFNQTLASDEEARDFLDACHSIILHNLKPFFQVQCMRFGGSTGLGIIKNFGFSYPCFYWTYGGERDKNYDHFVYDRWVLAFNELNSEPLTKWWNQGSRAAISKYLKDLLLTMYNAHPLPVVLLNFAVLFAVLLAALVFAVLLLRRYTVLRLTFCLCFVSITGLCLAVSLFMPEGRPVYMFATFSSAYITLYLLGAYLWKNRLKLRRDVYRQVNWLHSQRRKPDGRDTTLR